MLKDISNGQGFSLWERCGGPSCKNSSAEVISEAPSSAGILPLADFGIISPVNVHVTDKSRQKGGISSAHWEHSKIILVGTEASRPTLASPGRCSAATHSATPGSARASPPRRPGRRHRAAASAARAASSAASRYAAPNRQTCTSSGCSWCSGTLARQPAASGAVSG